MATAPPQRPAPTPDREASCTIAKTPNTAINTPSSIWATPRKRNEFSSDCASSRKLPLTVDDRVFSVEEKESAGDLTIRESGVTGKLGGLEFFTSTLSDPPLIVVSFT
jgi:hypothetical protein